MATIRTLTFTANGYRWRVRRLVGEPLPPAMNGAVHVTGLLFECDAAVARFLPLAHATMPSDDQLASAAVEELMRHLAGARDISL